MIKNEKPNLKKGTKIDMIAFAEIYVKMLLN
jgi:hypothetical protein